MAATAFEDWLADNGLDNDTIAYFKARGIKSKPLLARCVGPALDADAFKAKFLVPFRRWLGRQ